MDSLIAAASRALAAGDALGALKRVALRDDPPALALRGIAMAQLGEHPRARELLRKAARGFGGHEELARARCVVAEAEVALAMRDLGGSPRPLAAAAAALAARSDRHNALQARLIAVRRLLLLGRLDEAGQALAALELHAVPPALAAVGELTLASSRCGRCASPRRAPRWSARRHSPIGRRCRRSLPRSRRRAPRSSGRRREGSTPASRRRSASTPSRPCSRLTRSYSTAAGAACAPATPGSRWRGGRSCSPSPARSPRRGRAASTARP